MLQEARPARGGVPWIFRIKAKCRNLLVNYIGTPPVSQKIAPFSSTSKVVSLPGVPSIQMSQSIEIFKLIKLCQTGFAGLTIEDSAIIIKEAGRRKQRQYAALGRNAPP